MYINKKNNMSLVLLTPLTKLRSEAAPLTLLSVHFYTQTTNLHYPNLACSAAWWREWDILNEATATFVLFCKNLRVKMTVFLSGRGKSHKPAMFLSVQYDSII